MPNKVLTLPRFDDLRSALKYDFDVVQRESDPFRRLAWLIERQEAYLWQGGRKSDLPRILGLQDAAILLQECEQIVRDYHEMHCSPDFPRRLLREGLKPKTCQVFIDVLGEVERKEDDYGISLDADQVLDEIEYWLGFRQAALTVKTPVSGLSTALRALDECRKKLDGPGLSRGDVLGQVTEAFVQGETLLRQLLSFYGQILYGPGYIDAILQQYDQEVAEKARLASDVTSLPELSHELGEVLALPEAQQQRAVRSFLEDLLRGTRKVKFPAAESGRLRSLQEKGRGLGFLGYVQVLHSLDRWVCRACESSQADDEQRRGQRFERLFQRKRLFPSQAKVGNTMNVPVKEGNRIKTQSVPIKDEDPSPFVGNLRCLNAIRPLYVHEADPHFVHPSNLENMRNGAKEILDTFIKLWTGAQGVIFPHVVVVRRLLQIDANLVRLDYVPENSLRLQCIRVATGDLPPYTVQLLGQEVYLHIRYDEEGDIVLALYPVDG